MRSLSLPIAAAFLGLLAQQPAWSQDATFFNELKPMFDNCGDGSYQKAVKDGITLGFSEQPPEAMYDPGTKQSSGIDWEINKAALDWMGVTDIKTEWMPWESQVPSLLSGRTDVIAGNIHVNPDRLKVISFTGPAYWYGPVIVVAKGNPLGIKSYADLVGKKVGALSGGSPDAYLHNVVKVDVVPFKSSADQLQSLAQTRLDAILEDGIIFIEYKKANPSADVEALWSIPVPDDILYGGGFGYARFALRKEDCSLRAAYTQALAEIRANGHVSAILRKYGLTDQNFFWFPLQVQ